MWLFLVFFTQNYLDRNVGNILIVLYPPGLQKTLSLPTKKSFGTSFMDDFKVSSNQEEELLTVARYLLDHDQMSNFCREQDIHY
jgi:hypothetical protein